MPWFSSLSSVISPVIFLLVLAAALAPSVAWAQAPGLTVVSVTTSRPAVMGRYATVGCTVKNISQKPFTLKAVAVAILGPGGEETDFTVTPPHPPLPDTLMPGQSYPFRQFQQMPLAGDFVCVIRAEDSTGHGADLTFTDGRRAMATLHVVPLAAVPRVMFEVTDPHPNHVYAPGQTIALRVLPVRTGGPDLSSQVASVQIMPEAKPFSLSDSSAAAGLLQNSEFQADFYGAPEARKALDMTVTFLHPVMLAGWSLAGQNLNDQYGLKTCTASGVDAEGTVTPLPCITIPSGDRWTVWSAEPRPVSVTALRLRVTTPYKIDLQSLSVQGQAGAAQSVSGASAPAVQAQWRDGFGHPLTPPRLLTMFGSNAIVSPPHLPPGYYGLALTSAISGVDPVRHEYGFAVLPPPTGFHDDRLGMVHMAITEPYLGVRWIKTLATNFFDQTTFHLDVPGWQAAIAERRAHGLRELPLLSDRTWVSDSTKPIGADQLRRIHDEMFQHFQATPEVDHWELGLEENLGYRNHRAAWPFYWPNLAAKAQAVRQAAADAHVSATLIYQIAERDPQTVTAFCQSPAAREFDVLALHPYIWPDFPAPEHWMPPYLAQVRTAMARYHAVKPIWFTEIGAPMDGNPGGFFGYPSPGYFVRGMTRSEHAVYLVQCHMLAFSLGVAKIFWYTYRDSGSDPEYAEDHFGMIDVEEYPLPSYVAYSAMAREIGDKPFASARIVGGNVRAYRFHGGPTDTLVVWTYPATRKAISLAALGVRSLQMPSAVDLMGRPIAVHAGQLTVSSDPIYLQIQNRPSAPNHKETTLSDGPHHAN